MKNKTIVSFNQLQYEIDTNRLKKEMQKIASVLDSIEAITGTRKLTTLENINSVIFSKTNFSNIELASDLIGLKADYLNIKNNIHSLLLDVAEISEAGEVTLKASEVDAVKETHTTYLKDSLETDFKTLQEVCKAVNKLQNPNNAKYLKADYKGEYSVNLQALNNQI
jgi:hypothetical protein